MELALCTKLSVNSASRDVESHSAACVTIFFARMPASPAFPLFLPSPHRRPLMGRPAVRRGRALFFTLDEDATLLLQSMIHSPRARGSFFSELVRREARERAEREKLRALLMAAREQAAAEAAPVPRPHRASQHQ
jgi:hypothetical protein